MVDREELSIEINAQHKTQQHERKEQGTGTAVFGSLTASIEEASKTTNLSRIISNMTAQKTEKSPPPPLSFTCPLSGDLIENPVMCNCAHNFERRAIAEWLKNHSCCPISRKPLSSGDLVPNHTLGDRIDRWKWQQENDGIMVEESLADLIQALSSDEEDGVVRNDTEMMEQGLQRQRRMSRKQKRIAYKEVPSNLMLLPQEREVLAIVRAKEEQNLARLQKRRCYLAVLCILVTVILVLFSFIIYGYMQIRNEEEEGESTGSDRWLDSVLNADTL